MRTGTKTMGLVGMMVALATMPLLSCTSDNEGTVFQGIRQTSPQATPTSVPTVDLLAAAKAAKASGELELAEHNCLILITEHTETGEAVRLLAECRWARIDVILQKVDKTDRRSIRQSFDLAKDMASATEAEVLKVIQTDLSDKKLAEEERGMIYKVVQEIRTRGDELIHARREAFTAFARQHIEEAIKLYTAGKKPWYRFDDKTLFIRAIVELNYVNSVLNEVGDRERTDTVDWYNRLRSELNKAQYQEAVEKSKIILGTE